MGSASSGPTMSFNRGSNSAQGFQRVSAKRRQSEQNDSFHVPPPPVPPSAPPPLTRVHPSSVPPPPPPVPQSTPLFSHPHSSHERASSDKTEVPAQEKNKDAAEEKQKGDHLMKSNDIFKTELVEILKNLNLADHEMHSCKMLISENQDLLKILKVAIVAAANIQDLNENGYLSNLDISFHSAKQEHKEILGDFLTNCAFCKRTYEEYKSILVSNGHAYFSDVMEIPEKDLTKLELIRSLWWNLSDASQKFGTQLYSVGILQAVFQDLVNLTKIDVVMLHVSFTFESSMGILHNTARVRTLRQSFRDMKVVECLSKFLNIKNTPNVTMVLLLTLSLIIDEHQVHLLTSHDSVFDCLIFLTKNTLKTNDHRYNGFSADELIQGMLGLSRNDDVKKTFVKKRVLGLIKDILSTGNDKEREGGANLMWELSFNNEAKDKIKEDQALMNMMKDLSKNSNRKLAKACQGVLWVIDMDKEEHTERCEKNKSEENSTAGGHVMISYNWGDQKKIMEVRDALKQGGYNVWIDIDNMSGSTVDGMADAVENSAVVLICMSEEYKESRNCRLEALYAFQLQKPIIPLVMKRGYKPDGWLGILTGTKLFFDFSGKYIFENKLNDLVKELGENGKSIPTSSFQSETTDGPIVKSTGHVVGKSPRTSIPVNVSEWLATNDLEKYSRLQDLSSEHVVFLKKLSSRAPEFYYSFVIDLVSGTETVENITALMKITHAIENF